MPKIIFVSGACGCGKTTFSNAYVKYLVEQDHKTRYIIHGDDFHRGIVETEEKGDFFVDGQASDPVLWEDILKFNSNFICIIQEEWVLRMLLQVFRQALHHLMLQQAVSTFWQKS